MCSWIVDQLVDCHVLTLMDIAFIVIPVLLQLS